MGTYYKPQSPIQSGEDFIYPITTADQIVKSDNSRRLEQAGLIVADDSTKLGGKAPEYYLQPRNLLDNSDFRNPVNQRGQTSYTGQVYGIDRWYGGRISQKVEIRNTDVTVTAMGSSYAGIKQKIANIDRLSGKTVTLATYVYSTVGVAVGFTDGDDNTVSETVDNRSGSRVILCTCTVPSNATPDTFIPGILLRTTAQNDYMSCYWAALYEGSYTADTLPPYVPKEYAVELAACNSAPVSLNGGYGGGSLQAYPVGSIYMSVNSTSPASLFGGTWEQLKDRFLLGAGSAYAAGSTGGEAKHTLTEGEMPEHYHDLIKLGWGGDTSATIRNEGAYLVYDENSVEPLRSDYFGKAGGNQPHNNMPPYLAVYMWKRVS